MLVREAKDVARQWVLEEAAGFPGFSGAFLAGSINWLPEDAELPATSDVDLMVVRDDVSSALETHGKFIHLGAIVDVSYVTSDQLQSAETILGDYHRAGSFRSPNIILDPSGDLTRLQAAVSKGFAKRRWVLNRCEHARNHALRYVGMLRESDPLHDQVTAWSFAAGITTHVLLTAGLRNPTVRRRYGDVRELLTEYGRGDFYEPLLELQGCAQMSRARVEDHLSVLTEAFDAAKDVIKTPFSFAADISAAARPITIGGSRDLIERGLHREAVFWIIVTYSRCQKVFDHDAPELRDRFDPGYRELLADLGVRSFADLRQRTGQVEELLPQVWEVAQAIMAANPAIED
jgi:hypothetical protein